MTDKLIIGGKEITNRFFTGTGKHANNAIIPQLVNESGIEVITVALRRVDLTSPQENILNYIPKRCILLPNTSGARNAEEAVRIAKLARACGCGNWVKIEVISDNKYLLPDNYETAKATEMLVKEGFVVLPYVSPDLMVAKDLENAGAAAVMPLGAPIGTNRGLQTRELIRILIDEINLPIIVDAGIGRPSEAAEAMEMGAAAVLANTAVATARDPVTMAKAFSMAVEAGRKAYLAGLGPVKVEAEASSPLTGFLD
ncbi:thiazole synthase [Desulfohalotomaculum tongense]|uniref:thiazole synthase n=1 Tax=Desulforadius tongensis TaxID=1216062 RepID=UPI001956A708|nr:thiazole synthase [Desulforadius tongensis]MBM7855438.1 thiazole synthase [Desulforadius tongensis]